MRGGVAGLAEGAVLSGNADLNAVDAVEDVWAVEGAYFPNRVMVRWAVAGASVQQPPALAGRAVGWCHRTGSATDIASNG